MSGEEIYKSLSRDKAIYLLAMQKLATLKYRIDHYPNYDLNHEATIEECQKFLEGCEKGEE